VTNSANVNLLVGHQADFTFVCVFALGYLSPRFLDYPGVSLSGQTKCAALFAFLCGYDTEQSSVVCATALSFDLFAKSRHGCCISAARARG
jgi:hypothetical protein